MGLKWFRARLKINRKSKNSPWSPEFYRPMSQFDNDVQFPVQQSSVSRENRLSPSTHSVPTSPDSRAYNPMAGLKSEQGETSGARNDNGSKAKVTEEWQTTSSDEELSFSSDVREIPRHLPRESIELMRGGSTEASPRQLVVKSHKADFKKKKAKAPIPNTTSNRFDDARRSMKIDTGRGSDASEIEI